MDARTALAHLSSTLDRHAPHISFSPTNVALGLLASLAFYVFYNLFLHPLASIPGPLVARTGLGSWLTVRALKWDLGPALLAQHDKYGPVVRTGRNTVSVCDREAIDVL